MTESTKPAAPPTIDARLILEQIRLIKDIAPESAARMLDGLLPLVPEDARAHQLRGALYQKAGKLPEAIKHFELSVKIDPSCPISTSSLGRCLFESGRTKEAEQYLRVALDLDPGSYLVAKNLGFCLTKSGQYEEGVQHLRAALKSDPENPAILNGLGYALCALGDKAKQDARALPAIVESAVASGVPKASGVAHALFRLKDELSSVAQRGDSYYRESLDCLQKAVAKNPANAIYQLNLGWCLVGLGRYDEATEALKQARTLDPRSAKTSYFLALAYREIALDFMERGELTWDESRAGKMKNNDARKGALGFLNDGLAAAAWAYHQSHQRPPSPEIGKLASGLQYGDFQRLRSEIDARLEASRAALKAPAPVAA